MKKKRAFYKKLMCVWLLVPTLSFADNLSLSDVISATRIACSSISDELTDLKKMTEINTAVTAVGTVAGGALGTGVAKASRGYGSCYVCV